MSRLAAIQRHIFELYLAKAEGSMDHEHGNAELELKLGGIDRRDFKSLMPICWMPKR